MSWKRYWEKIGKWELWPFNVIYAPIGPLWLMEKDGTIWLKDEKGGMAKVTIADVNQSNGVIHVIDTVVMPKS